MSIKLKAQKRDLAGEKLDKNKVIPAVLYGKNVDNLNLILDKVEFDKVYQEAGESNLLDLEVGDNNLKVIIKDVAYHPVKHSPIHVDLYQVNMKEKITTVIPLEFIGEAKAVKELGGLLMKYTDEVEVQCLPGDLIDHIDVDISGLNNFEDSIHMGDLNLPQSMELMREKDEIVVNVIAPKEESEEEEEVEEKKEDESKETGENEEKKDSESEK
jgi:large subunit ribosomal protein L25